MLNPHASHASRLAAIDLCALLRRTTSSCKILCSVQFVYKPTFWRCACASHVIPSGRWLRPPGRPAARRLSKWCTCQACVLKTSWAQERGHTLCCVAAISSAYAVVSPDLHRQEADSATWSHALGRTYHCFQQGPAARSGPTQLTLKHLVCTQGADAGCAHHILLA